MEDGILKRSLLSLKKIDMEDFSNMKFQVTTIYKHYIFCFNPENKHYDCVIIDTQREAVLRASTGLCLGAATDFSICYWKDNTFVILNHLPAENRGLGFVPKRFQIHLLQVNEKDSQISFNSKYCHESMTLLGERPSYSRHDRAQIYKDHLYILTESGLMGSGHAKVWKYDLNENIWSKCETTGEAPMAHIGPAGAVFNNKIYFLGGFNNREFPIIANDIFVLEIGSENMSWKKIPEKDSEFYNIRADVVGEKILIQSKTENQFYIFDPINETLKTAEGVSPAQGFMIRSHGERSLIFRFQDSYVEYHDFSQENKIKEIEPLVKNNKDIFTQTQHMDLLWKEKLFADITFVVENEEILAHRNILVKCPYFLNMFTSGMMESTSQKIPVPDISLVNFKAILEYIYYGKITFTERLAMDLLVIADMFCMAGLKKECEAYLSLNMKTTNLLDILKAAETAGSEKLESQIVKFVLDNLAKLDNEIGLPLIPADFLAKCLLKTKGL